MAILIFGNPTSETLVKWIRGMVDPLWRILIMKLFHIGHIIHGGHLLHMKATLLLLIRTAMNRCDFSLSCTIILWAHLNVLFGVLRTEGLIILSLTRSEHYVPSLFLLLLRWILTLRDCDARILRVF